MDSYLELAKKVLEEARRPLTPREILREAYRLELVPVHLHGATQHKTLQARMSEHIVDFRDNAIFFRTAPGRFFLRRFLNDLSIPAEFRQPIVARRRTRELRRREVLAVPKGALPRPADAVILSPEVLQEPFDTHCYRYATDVTTRQADDVLVWSFVVVLRDTEVLTYRHGRYREDRDGFLQRRSIGFYSPVIKSDRGLFDQDDHGLVASGLETLAVDLDIARDHVWNDLATKAQLQSFVYAQVGTKADLLGVVRLDCPKWFEPLTRRLAINDLTWHDLSVPANHVEDYDPWSQIVLIQAQRWARETAQVNGATGTRSNRQH